MLKDVNTEFWSEKKGKNERFGVILDETLRRLKIREF